MSRSSFISRRGFLGIGGASAALALVGGGAWLSGDDAVYRQLSGGFEPEILSLKEFGVLSALASAMIAPLPGGPSVRDAMTPARIDKELSFHPESTLAEDIKASLVLLEHAPLLSGLGPRFSELDEAGQKKFLSLCAAGGPGLLRSAYAGIRFLVVFFYYTDDRTWPGIGYAGPTTPEKLFEGGNRIANLKQKPGATKALVKGGRT